MQERRRISWHFWLPQVAGAVVYLLVGAYQVGAYSARMTAVEKSVDELKTEIHDMATRVEWRK